MTTKLTREDMLKVVVEAAADGGWFDRLGILYFHSMEVTSCNKTILHHSDMYHDDHEDTYSLPDLLADRAFMKSAWKDDGCIKWHTENATCNESTCKKIGFNARCDDYLSIPRYHMHKAFDLISDNKDAVEYLYNNLPKGEDDE